jgi:hypothetical protein
VARVQRHAEPVEERAPLVAPEQEPAHVPRIALEETGSDPDGVSVDEHADLGRLPGRRPFLGLARDEVRDEGRSLPRRLVDASVDPDLAGADARLAHRPRRRRRGRRGRERLLRGHVPREEHGQQESGRVEAGHARAIPDGLRVEGMG